MTWHVGTEVDLKTKQTVAYTVENQSQSLPVDIRFGEKQNAQKLCEWLNVKDDWIDNLENVLDHVSEERMCYDFVDELKEKFKSSRGLSEFDTVI